MPIVMAIAFRGRGALCASLSEVPPDRKRGAKFSRPVNTCIASLSGGLKYHARP